MTFASSRYRRRGRALGDSYVGTAVLDYVLQSNAQGYIGQPIYSSYDGVDQPTQYIGYAPGVTPPEVQQVLDAGYLPETGEFNNALLALLKSHGAAFKPAGSVIAATTTFVPTPPPPPVLGPETYLENGVTYTNYDDAVAALQAGPPPPPASTTGVVHYDPGTDSYQPGPSPGGVIVAPPATDPVVTSQDPLTGATTTTTTTTASDGSVRSWSTGTKVLAAAGVGGLAWWLVRRL